MSGAGERRWYGMIGDYPAYDVVQRGYLELSDDPDEADRQARRLLDAIKEMLAGSRGLPAREEVFAAVLRSVVVDVDEGREWLGREAAILTAAQKAVRVATAIADTIDESGMSEKDRWLVDELRAALEDLRAVP